MKTPRIPATLSEVTSTLLRDRTIIQQREILTTGISPVRLLKIRGEK